MIPGMALDTGTVLVLAAVALMEGLTRVPAGALILRRRLGGSWKVAGRVEVAQLRLVHFWPPCTETLVLQQSSEPAPAVGRTELLSRLDRIESPRRWAGGAGLLTQLILIVGIPLGIGAAGAVGGLLVAGGVLLGQAALWLLAWRGLRRLGTGRPARRRLLLSILNPFAAPAVSSRLMAEACAGATPLTVAQTLLPHLTWATWIRRRAYDADAQLIDDREMAEQLEESGRAITQVLELRPEMGHQEQWCPRCAATYQAGFTECRDCEVNLLRADESFRPRGAGRLASASAD
jgi:ribosomal protein L40E